MRTKLFFALLLAACALVAAEKTAESSADTQSLATTTTISGILTFPGCNMCPSCSNCIPAAQPPAAVNTNTITTAVLNKVVTKEMKAVKASLLKRLKKSLRLIKRLGRDNKRLRSREDSIEQQNAKLASRITTLQNKVKNVQLIPGPAGPRGARGRRGRRGPAGPRGLPGATGAPGTAGRQGPMGPPGRDGRNGAPGKNGREGPRGNTGPAGPRGQQGPIGPRGPAGAAGPRGPAGPRGDRGANGAAGARGPAGPRGEKGSTGPAGPRGAAGRDGRNGAPGPAGARGAPGAAGAAGRNGAPGPAGPKGPAGPQGPAGVAGKAVVLEPARLRSPPEPVTLIATKVTGMSWDDAETACASNGLRLCPFKTLCYNGKTDENDFFTHSGYGWVPYGGDGDNAWLYLGNSPGAFCKTHPQLSNGLRPPWGRTQDRANYRGALYCCGDKPIKETPKVIGYSYAMSWDDQIKACQANGMELCNYLSICPEGPDHKPYNKKIWTTPSGWTDVWTAVNGEGDNQWVQFGKGWPICQRHTEIANGVHGRPGWGAVRDWGAHHGPILCCGGKDRIQETHLMAKKSSGMSWDEAQKMCKTNGMGLCNFDSICPNGWNGNSIVERRKFDDWIPFDDNQGVDSWLQIGQPWPQCERHSEVGGGGYGRPGWGNDRSTYAFKGEVFCCGKKPEAATDRLDLGSSAGNSWNDANAKCMSKAKKLCTFNDICPKGPDSVPIMGKQRGDDWIPIDDAGDNMWLQIGEAWPACNRHTEIANGIHGRPGWGLGRGAEHFRGHIYCC